MEELVYNNCVGNNNTITIDTKNLVSGMYFITVINNGNQTKETIKLVKW